MKRKSSERVYVVAFTPADGNGVGGFDWFFDYHGAQRRMIEHMVEEEPTYQYTLVPLAVPSSFDKDRKERNEEIETWIDRHMALVSVPIQKEFCDALKRE